MRDKKQGSTPPRAERGKWRFSLPQLIFLAVAGGAGLWLVYVTLSGIETRVAYDLYRRLTGSDLDAPLLGNLSPLFQGWALSLMAIFISALFSRLLSLLSSGSSFQVIGASEVIVVFGIGTLVLSIGLGVREASGLWETAGDELSLEAISPIRDLFVQGIAAAGVSPVAAVLLRQFDLLFFREQRETEVGRQPDDHTAALARMMPDITEKVRQFSDDFDKASSKIRGAGDVIQKASQEVSGGLDTFRKNTSSATDEMKGLVEHARVAAQALGEFVTITNSVNNFIESGNIPRRENS